MTTPPGRILVIRGGAIGDFIVTLPALAALKRRFPNSELEVLGYPQIAALAEAGGLANAVHPIESRTLAQFFAPDADLDPDWSRFFASFDTVVSYIFDPDTEFQKNVRRVSKARYIAGQHRPDELKPMSASATFLVPLQALGISNDDPIPKLVLKEATARPRADYDLAIHPGSGSPSKNWPEAGWTNLLSDIAVKTSWRLLMIAGPSEVDMVHRLASTLPESRVAVAAQLPLPRLAERIICCRRFLGHDSGITHLAAAVGCPTTALWGPSNLAVWRPLGQHVQIIRPPISGLANLPESKVWEALTNLTDPIQST